MISWPLERREKTGRSSYLSLMAHTSIRLIWLGLLLIATGGPWMSCYRTHSTPKLQIAVAANAQFVIQQLIPLFEAQSGVGCELMVGSSGKLTAQIMGGAPFDILISADLKYPATLHQNQLTLAPPKTYAQGKLVLWTVKPNLYPSLKLLTDVNIKHIAIANPKIAPYGRAAEQVLDNINFDANKKLVFGESISQTNQFILSQAADIGFTAKSVVLAPHIQDRGRWIEIEQERYAPIEQGVVAIDNGRHMEKETEQFIDFLLSGPAQKLLSEFGYQSIIPSISK